MAGRGPAPKPDAERLRRNKNHMPMSNLDADDDLRGPDLPDGPWPTATRRWWETWRRSAQAQTFCETDWEFLLETALLHAMFWKGKVELAGELRIRVAKFGATPEDRMRLRLTVGSPKPVETERKVPAAGRKDRLLRAVQ